MSPFPLPLYVQKNNAGDDKHGGCGHRSDYGPSHRRIVTDIIAYMVGNRPGATTT